MMNLKQEIKDIKSTRKDLRKFGLTLGIFFGLLGAWILWRHRHLNLYLFIASGSFLFLAAIAPILLKPVQRLWMGVALLIGWVMTRVILIFLFYVVVTPLGFFARLSGKDFLDRSFDRTRESYWIDRKKTNDSKDDYEKQF